MSGFGAASTLGPQASIFSSHSGGGPSPQLSAFGSAPNVATFGGNQNFGGGSHGFHQAPSTIHGFSGGFGSSPLFSPPPIEKALPREINDYLMPPPPAPAMSLSFGAPRGHSSFSATKPTVSIPNVASLSGREQVMLLMRHQSVDGSWTTTNSQVMEILNIPPATMKSLLLNTPSFSTPSAVPQGQLEPVWVTIVALCWLALKQSSEKSVWSLSARKAAKFIARATGWKTATEKSGDASPSSSIATLVDIPHEVLDYIRTKVLSI